MTWSHLCLRRRNASHARQAHNSPCPGSSSQLLARSFFGELLDVATRRWRNAYAMAPPIPPDHRWLGEIALLAVRVARLTSSETRLSVHRASAQANQTSSDQRSSLWRATKPAQQQTKHAQPDQHNRTYCTWELDLEMHIDRNSANEAQAGHP